MIKSDKYYDQVRSVFDDFGRRMDGYYDSGSHWKFIKQTLWQSLVRHSIISYFRDNLSTNCQLDLLDAGCGRGDFTSRLHELFGFRKSLGIDFASAMLEVADGDYGQIPGLSFSNVDLSQKLPFQNDKFDVSLALNILHHLLPDDQQNLIGELCRITKAAIVVEIKLPHILWRIRGGYRAFGHLQFYPSELQLIEKLFLKQGYGLVATRPIFHFAAISPIVLLIFNPAESNSKEN